MSYIYSNGLCHEALRLMSLDEEFESRLLRAFSEMGVSREGDTSNEIWKEWKELEKMYHKVSGEIFQQREKGIVTGEMTAELRKFSESLVALICDWMEFNNGQISKGKLRKAS